MARPWIRQRQRLQLACLLLTASYASASLTLSDFQLTTSMVIPLSCVFAYNTPLYYCKINDFTMGKACSAKCKASIDKAQENIKASCQGATVAEDTLLYEAQKGHLVEVICNNADKPSATSTVVEPVTSVGRFTTIRATMMTSFSTLSSTSTETSTSTKESSRRLTTSTTDDTETVPPTTTSEPATSESTSETFVTTSTLKDDPPQATTTDAQTSAENVDETSTSTESKAPRRTVLPGSGGGSPFDFVAAGHETRPSLVYVFATMSTVVCAMLLR